MERFMRSMIDQLNLSMKSGAATQISPDSQKQKQPENPYSKQIKDLEETVKKLSKEVASSLDKFHPIGSIYCSEDPTEPETLFGGTWERIKDRFLLAAGSSYKAGATGGEATHTLTIDEMPSHSHKWPTQETNSIYVEQWWDWAWRASAFQQEKTPDSVPGGTQYVGGSQPHNNMPPYLAVYVWKRTA